MKTFLVPLIALLVILSQPSSANAALCAQCQEKNFIQNIGACKVCQAMTPSGGFKLCKKCSDKLAQCEACQADLKPKTETEPAVKEAPPAAVIKSPGGKAYPTHWGAPPKMQTRDIRPLPGGYGSGSGTLATWIQKNLDNDAKAPAEPVEKKPDAAKEAEIQQIEKKIAEMEDFAKRARFTPEGMKKHQDELAALKQRLAELKGESKPK